MEQSEHEKVQKALAQMPPEKAAIAEGIALRLQGYSYRKAAEIAGCNHETLRRNVQKLGVSERDINQMVRDGAALAYEITDEAGRQTIEALQEGRLKDSQLPIVYGIAMDKLTRIQAQYRGEAAAGALEAVISKLSDALDGKTVSLTIEPAPPDAEAIDVTPEEES